MNDNKNRDDIRWIKRLSNYEEAFCRLEEVIELYTERDLSFLEKMALIRYFQQAYHLSWKALKDFYEQQGDSDIQGSRDVFILALQRGLISNTSCMRMVRAMREHVPKGYLSGDIVAELSISIKDEYFPILREILISLQRQKPKYLAQEQWLQDV